MYKPNLIFQQNSTKTIFCRFFFFLLLFFEYYFLKQQVSFFWWCFKSKKKHNSVLKAPHHYKVAQTKLVSSYYSVIFFIKFNLLNLFWNIFLFSKEFNFFFFCSSFLTLKNQKIFYLLKKFK